MKAAVREVRRVLIGAGVLEQLPRELDGLGARRRLLMVADANTYRAAGETAMDVLVRAGWQVGLCLLDSRGELKAGEEVLGRLLSALGPEEEFLLAVGAGTINDLTKYAAHLTGRSYAVVATAPSMDGYASPVAALTVRGVKKTCGAIPPVAVFGDLQVLGSAPPEMIRAGFGDLLGKYTALADWRLGHVVAGEGFSRDIASGVRRAVDSCSQAAGGGDKDQYVLDLTLALVESGLAMLKWGDSRPASGAEHHVAHFLEMFQHGAGQKTHLHGIRVGVAEVYMSALYHNLFRMDAGTVKALIGRKKPEGAAAARARVEAAFGPAAGQVLEEQGGYYLDEAARRERHAAILANWDQLRECVKDNVPRPARIRELLRAAGAPTSFEELGIPASLAVSALDNSKEIRSRYTVLRLAEDLGLAPATLC